MRRISGIILAITFFALAACASKKTEPTLWVGPQVNDTRSNVCAILPFGNLQENKYEFPEAAETVRDSFETAFLEAGYQIVERSMIEKIISELKFSMSGFTDQQGIEVGKMLNVGAVIFGAVTSYNKERLTPAIYTTVGFSVKAVDVETGVIIWKGNHTRTVYWDIFDTDSLPSLSREVAKEIVASFLKKTANP